MNIKEKNVCLDHHSLDQLVRSEKEVLVWLGLVHDQTESSLIQFPSHSTHLVGMYRLVELLIKAFIDNPPIPILFSTEIEAVTYLSKIIKPTLTATSIGPFEIDDSIDNQLVKQQQQQQCKNNDDWCLKFKIKQVMIHLVTGSWDCSVCFIVLVNIGFLFYLYLSIDIFYYFFIFRNVEFDLIYKSV